MININMFVLQLLKDFASERAKKMVIIFHISDKQLKYLLSVLSDRNWNFRLHTLAMNQSSNDTQYWVVCWKVDDGDSFLRETVTKRD
jgi:hypothetical protein